VIPYAGGPVASLLGEWASGRKIDKICDVLAHIHETLHDHKIDPTKHLTEDQVIEVVHDTLSEVSTSSDQKKINALKRGLGYAFTSDDPFERKQLYLKVLRELTSLEILMLSTLYGASDPYQLSFRDPSYSIPDYSKPATYHGGVLKFAKVAEDGAWRRARNFEKDEQPVLGDYLADKASINRQDADAALRRLDAQGLSSAGPNLDSRRAVWSEWVPRSPSLYSAIVPTTMTIGIGEKVLPSAMEASRTDFGREFIRYFVT
jgi:hypothetical protein